MPAFNPNEPRIVLPLAAFGYIGYHPVCPPGLQFVITTGRRRDKQKDEYGNSYARRIGAGSQASEAINIDDSDEEERAEDGNGQSLPVTIRPSTMRRPNPAKRTSVSSATGNAEAAAAPEHHDRSPPLAEAAAAPDRNDRRPPLASDYNLQGRRQRVGPGLGLALELEPNLPHRPRAHAELERAQLELDASRARLGLAALIYEETERRRARQAAGHAADKIDVELERARLELDASRARLGPAALIYEETERRRARQAAGHAADEIDVDGPLVRVVSDNLQSGPAADREAPPGYESMACPICQNVMLHPVLKPQIAKTALQPCVPGTFSLVLLRVHQRASEAIEAVSYMQMANYCAAHKERPARRCYCAAFPGDGGRQRVLLDIPGYLVFSDILDTGLFLDTRSIYIWLYASMHGGRKGVVIRSRQKHKELSPQRALRASARKVALARVRFTLFTLFTPRDGD
ncbi:hypothetical protein K438DRAFT_1759625 [Mycena galopus ATCC 62051]|nr:hypothetical protein K438DRAFT_1759625 [Mycena galopus ATCC 62051]